MLPVWYRIQRDTDRTPRVKAKCTIDSTKCHTKTNSPIINGTLRVKSWSTWHTFVEIFSNQFYQNKTILKLISGVSS